MALHMIIGDTSCGKSHLVCKRLAQASADAPDERFIAIVPEQATLLMQKSLMEQHPKKVITNIDIASFGFLAELVFEEQGMAITDILDDTGKALILRKVLEEKRDDLQVYGKKVRMPGFVEEIKSIITELKQYDIDDNALFLMQEAAEAGGNRLLFAKLQDLRLIYRSFEEQIAERYTTAEEILSVLAGQVPSSKLLAGATIYMDGFTGFTPVQYKLIGQLLSYAKDVIITATLPETQINDACPEQELFSLSNRTYFKLLELAQAAGVQASTEVCRPQTEFLAHKNQEIKIYAAANPEEEVLFTAATIRNLVRSRDYRFRDIAVVVSDMEAYHRFLADHFDDAGISYFIDHKKKLSENVLAHFLLAAIRLVTERFSYDAVMSYVKTGLTALSFTEAAKLENYCLEFGLKGIRAFRKEFTKNRTDDPVWNLEELNASRRRLLADADPFYQALSASGNTAAAYRQALVTLFEHNQVEEKLAAQAAEFTAAGELALGKEYEQIYEQTLGLLEKIETITAQEVLPPSDYADLVGSGLEEIKVGVIPPSLDAVVIGDLTRTRLSRIKALFLIGANEGKLPKTQSGSLIFSQRERQFLKAADFELAPTVLENIFTQRFYLYLMLSKPEANLWVTYAQMAADGSAMTPSFLLQELPLPLKQTEVKKRPEAVWESQMIRKLAASIRDPDAEMLHYLAKARPERLQQILNGAFFSNRQLPLDADVAAALYGGVIKGSVSRYEKFADCPFKHFMQYGIRAEKRPEYELQATDIGTVYHDSLERYSKKMLERGYTFRAISDADSHQLIAECVEEAVQMMDHDVLESTARNEYLKERILQVSKTTTDVLRSQVKDGKYEPAFFELKFGKNLSEDVRFTGKIDRVDLYDGEDVFVKIIDYKSGNTLFQVMDIYTGVQLQLVAYLNEALQTARKQFPGRQVHPGGVYYYHIQDKFVRTEEDAQNKFRMSGLTNCDKEALSAIDTTVDETHPGDSRIVEVKYGKTGLSSYSKVANTEEFRHLLGFVNDKIKDISTQVKEGHVDIAPRYKDERNNACTFCDYRDVCKFEDGQYGTSWNKEAENVTKAEAEQAVFGRIAETSKPQGIEEQER